VSEGPKGKKGGNGKRKKRSVPERNHCFSSSSLIGENLTKVRGKEHLKEEGSEKIIGGAT